MRSRQIKEVFAVGLSISLAVACGQTKTKSKITIGAVLTQSGQSGSGTGVYTQGIELGITEVNKGGGVLGNTLEVVFKDSQGDKVKAGAAAKELVDLKVPVVIGDSTSGRFRAVAEQTIPAGIVAISGSATNPAITNLQDNDLVFRNAPSDAFQGPGAGEVDLRQGSPQDRGRSV